MKIPNLITNRSTRLPNDFARQDGSEQAKQAPDAAGAILGAGNGNPSVSFVVPCVPVAQPRQRHRVIQSGGRAFATNYTPKSDPVNAFKATIRLVYCQARHDRGTYGPAWDVTAPMRVVIVAVFPRPKSKTRKRSDNPREPKASKPDVDNIAKGIFDSLTGLAWNDDAQIVEATVSKWIAAADESPHVRITIETV